MSIVESSMLFAVLLGALPFPCGSGEGEGEDPGRSSLTVFRTVLLPVFKIDFISPLGPSPSEACAGTAASVAIVSATAFAFRFDAALAFGSALAFTTPLGLEAALALGATFVSRERFVFAAGGASEAVAVSVTALFSAESVT